ncbi:MAG: PQQ-binding-like beta-propeller repeat protein, partial [Planctomycetota bacterium]
MSSFTNTPDQWMQALVAARSHWVIRRRRRSQLLTRRLIQWLLLLIVSQASLLGSTRAQVLPIGDASSVELAGDVQLELIDASTRNALERVRAHLAANQWAQGVSLLAELADAPESKLVDVGPARYVSFRAYCQLQLVSLPPEALKIYRASADSRARAWYEQGISDRNPQLLEQVAGRALASSWADESLWALGEMLMEGGDLAGARWAWLRCLPVDRSDSATWVWPGVADSSIDPAAVRARLVLASILAGAHSRARQELASLAQLHPDAHGRLGGREVPYAAALQSLLQESEEWPALGTVNDWPTFGGAADRNARAAARVDPSHVAWRIALPGFTAAPPPGARPTTMLRSPLSYYPIAVGGGALVATPREIIGVGLETGDPLWPRAPREIFRDGLPPGADAFRIPFDAFGTPRLTLTAVDGVLLSRMGLGWTTEPMHVDQPSSLGQIVCLDLASQGKLLWKHAPEEGWAIDGTPVSDGASAYVALRLSGARPAAYAACFDLRQGRLKWQRYVCAADTPARGMLRQSSHSLLTLDQGRLYFSTGLGAVAALSADDGELLWVSTYPRAKRLDLANPAAHWQREVSPCLIHDGQLYVAPADSPRVFAFDAASGQRLWQTGEETGDILHLVGAVGPWLVAAGGKLYWIRAGADDGGGIARVWPEGASVPGHGRPTIAGGEVIFPTRDGLVIFNLDTGQPLREVDLRRHGAGGGNLVAADGRLLVATPNELICLGPTPAQRKNNSRTSEPGELTVSG